MTRHTCRALTLIAVALLCSTMPPTSARAQSNGGARARRIERTVMASVDTLLSAYARKDVAAVLRGVDTQRVVWFGTDATEVRAGGAEFVRQLRDDFALWDSSRFAAPRHESVQREASVATAYFEVPWTAFRGGGSARYLLRFATTWRRGADARWRLVQVMNSVATEGRAAADRAARGGARTP